eukprot:2480921-Alexandrium_andersonii.AAC.1
MSAPDAFWERALENMALGAVSFVVKIGNQGAIVLADWQKGLADQLEAYKDRARVYLLDLLGMRAPFAS